MSLDGLSPLFWQYAIIKQNAIDTKKLTYVATHQVICSAIPPGDQLVAEIYSAGQKSSPVYPRMQEAVTTCVGKYDWKKAMA